MLFAAYFLCLVNVSEGYVFDVGMKCGGGYAFYTSHNEAFGFVEVGYFGMVGVQVSHGNDALSVLFFLFGMFVCFVV
ncbi:hypothetical protein D9M72_296110 [compost metagenome]